MHSIPQTAPLALGKILESCWQFKPEDRPEFKNILAQLRPVAAMYGTHY